MDFQVGQNAVHCAYGPGMITKLDEKEIAGKKAVYYVFEVKDLKIWIPVDEEKCTNLRKLTPALEFPKLFEILSSRGETLSTDRNERKAQLSDSMKDGSLESICGVIRDLSWQAKIKKLSENDSALLERAQDFLLAEWRASLAVPLSQAEQELKSLLTISQPVEA
ncbi:MAG: hypothetical protein EHM41_12455 [Chloroflexi bacterium]|nr:MAG: hypothetical protein EHM41_12455 [Chloroflexota bacterium]